MAKKSGGSKASSSATPTPAASVYTTRPALRRVMEIDRLIREGRYPNQPWLARHFEVDESTIYRDLRHMRDQLHLDPAYDRARNGYYYRDEPLAPPNLNITEGDIFYFAIGRFAVESYRGLALEKGMKRSFEKFASHLDARLNASIDGLRAIISFRPSGFPAPVDPKVFETVHTATASRRELMLDYQKPEEDRPRQRRLEPLHITVFDQAWYFFARDVADGLIKKFMISRATKPVRTTREFEYPADFDPEKYLKGGMGMFGGENPEPIVLRFKKSAVRRVKERIWHESQEFRKEKEGELEMRLCVEVNLDLERFLWGFGGEVRVVEPQRLRERLRAVAKATLAWNGDEDPDPEPKAKPS